MICFKGTIHLQNVVTQVYFLGLPNLSESHLIHLLKFCGVWYTPTVTPDWGGGYTLKSIIKASCSGTQSASFDFVLARK